MTLVQQQGALNWVRIASMLRTRTPKQCRERYHQNLKPSLNHEPITPQEGALIEQLVHDIGKRWAEIARRLKGRSDNAVKNWWNGSQNRRKRMDRRKPDHGPDMAGYERHPVGAHGLPPHGLPPSRFSFPGTGRPLPPPLLPVSLFPERSRYMETPLSSPSMYSPASDNASSLIAESPSYMSCASAVSPRSFDFAKGPLVRYRNLELPPIKIDRLANVASPPSTADLTLPSLSAAITSPTSCYVLSPSSVTSRDDFAPRLPPWGAPALTSPCSPRPHLPTAPSSPMDFSHTPPGKDALGPIKEEPPSREERSTREAERPTARDERQREERSIKEERSTRVPLAALLAH